MGSTFYKKIAALVIVGFIFVLFNACSTKDVKVLVLLKSTLDISYDDLTETANEWGKEKGVEIEIAAPTLALASEQQELLESYLEKDEWDLIIIEPVNDAALAPVVDYAKRRGSLVASVQGSSALGADYYVHPCDYDELGKNMMDSIGQLMGSSGDIVSVVPDKTNDVYIKMENGSGKEQKSLFPLMAFVSRLEESTSADDTMETMERLDKAYQPDGVLFYSYSEGQGIAGWKNRSGSQIPAVGIGVPELMKKELEGGYIDVLYYWNRPNLLRTTLEVSYRALNGRVNNETSSITTNIEGYERLRLDGIGTFVGSDIATY